MKNEQQLLIQSLQMLIWSQVLFIAMSALRYIHECSVATLSIVFSNFALIITSCWYSGAVHSSLCITQHGVSATTVTNSIN